MESLTVSELVGAIKYNLESSFSSIQVEGEITNLTKSSNGHYYFTLSDKDSSISAVLFRMSALGTDISEFKNGDVIGCIGSIGVYAKRGNFQIIVKTLFRVGTGILLKKLEDLKKKLAIEGLFDIRYKKVIPSFPKKVAIITALQGAALADFLKTVTSRFFLGNIVIIPSLVQGAEAASSLIDALSKVKKIADVDLIVFTRGGGSLEDLWPFNSEDLARAVFNQDIPVISAIGHEVDFTILDYVSDLRAATPTAAAMLISSASFSLQERTIVLRKLLQKSIYVMLQQMMQKLVLIEYIKQSALIKFANTKTLLEEKNPRYLERFINLPNYLFKLEESFLVFNNIYKTLDILKNRLQTINMQQLIMANLTKSSLALNSYYDRSKNLIDFNRYKLQVDASKTTFNAFKNKLVLVKSVLEGLYNILRTVRPSSVLERGYTMISHQGNIVDYQTFTKLPTNTEIEIEFADGKGNVRKV